MSYMYTISVIGAHVQRNTRQSRKFSFISCPEGKINDHSASQERITRRRRKAAKKADSPTTTPATLKQAPAPARANSIPRQRGAMIFAIVLTALSILQEHDGAWGA